MYRLSPERYLDDLLEAEEVGVEADEGVRYVHPAVQQDPALHGTREICERGTGEPTDGAKPRRGAAAKHDSNRGQRKRWQKTSTCIVIFHTNQDRTSGVLAQKAPAGGKTPQGV